MKLIVPCEPTCTASVIAEFKSKYGMYNKGNFSHTDDTSFSHPDRQLKRFITIMWQILFSYTFFTYRTGAGTGFKLNGFIFTKRSNTDHKFQSMYKQSIQTYKNRTNYDFTFSKTTIYTPSIPTFQSQKLPCPTTLKFPPPVAPSPPLLLSQYQSLLINHFLIIIKPKLQSRKKII